MLNSPTHAISGISARLGDNEQLVMPTKSPFNSLISAKIRREDNLTVIFFVTGPQFYINGLS